MGEMTCTRAHIWIGCPKTVRKSLGDDARIVHENMVEKFAKKSWNIEVKPHWGPKIDVVGFCFLDLASNYEPPESLVKWLGDGDKPIYIGFGSLLDAPFFPINDSNGYNGSRSGWTTVAVPTVVAETKFPRLEALVHHGGAGTTAAGLKAACPTTIVPFFGDQPFWGDRVHARGVGPPPIPVDEFSLPKLVGAIEFMLDPKSNDFSRRDICMIKEKVFLNQLRLCKTWRKTGMEGEPGNRSSEV
ncbi:hypothetical protein V8G54_009245 [Vigna mungo]|uniref:Uncharacterized protein n=1 Tax=Vigna mungo TaxID=3915 RepID=A0AAQ3S4N7_VIGMU